MANKNTKNNSSSNNYNASKSDVVVKARRTNGLLIALLGAGVAFIGAAEVYTTHNKTNKSVVSKSPNFTKILYGESKIVRARFAPENYKPDDKAVRNNKSLFKNFFASDNSKVTDETNAKREGVSIFDFLKRKTKN